MPNEHLNTTDGSRLDRSNANPPKEGVPEPIPPILPLADEVGDLTIEYDEDGNLDVEYHHPGDDDPIKLKHTLTDKVKNLLAGSALLLMTGVGEAVGYVHPGAMPVPDTAVVSDVNSAPKKDLEPLYTVTGPVVVDENIELRSFTAEELIDEKRYFKSKKHVRERFLTRLKKVLAVKKLKPSSERFLIELISDYRYGFRVNPRDPMFGCILTQQKKMSRHFGRCERQIRYYIADFVEAKLIKRHHKKHRHGKDCFSTEACYILTIGPLDALDRDNTAEVLNELSLSVESDWKADENVIYRSRTRARNINCLQGFLPDIKTSFTTRVSCISPIAKSSFRRKKSKEKRKNLTYGKRYEKVQGFFQKDLKKTFQSKWKYYAQQIRKRIELFDAVDIRWRGGNEVYLAELLVHNFDRFDAKLRAVESKLLAGSQLTRGAIINAATSLRKELKSEKSLAKSKKQQRHISTFESVTNQLLGQMSLTTLT